MMSDSHDSTNQSSTTVYQGHDETLYPKWLDDDHLDLHWLQSKLVNSGLIAVDSRIVSCSHVADASNQTRRGARVRDGATLVCQATLEQPHSVSSAPQNDASSPSPTNHVVTTELPLLIKQVPPSGKETSRKLGLAREALFYQWMQQQRTHQQPSFEPTGTSVLQKMIPTVYYAAGDMETGDKVVLMEDLSDVAVDSAVFFAPTQAHLQRPKPWPGNPNLWQRSNPIMTAIRMGAMPSGLTKGSSIPSQAVVAESTFRTMARIHARFWRNRDILLPWGSRSDWLRGGAWLQGRDEESWCESQRIIQTIYRQATQDGTWETCIEWDANVLETVHAAMRNISWSAQRERLNESQSHWTLVHGDFWPGNVLWMTNRDVEENGEDESIVRLIDWEMCGVGSGPQELGQYVISNMEPDQRRDCERHLVQVYLDELVKGGVSDVTWEYCWREYQIGGVERWLWFLVYFIGIEGFLDWTQFFHDQIASFMADHQLTASDVVQPRP